MKSELRELRLKQVDRTLSKFQSVSQQDIPPGGWIVSIRTALGTTLQQLGDRLKLPYQAISQFEKSEAARKITLQSLQRVADAMDCDLVYALVPRKGSLAATKEAALREKVRTEIMAVEHTMALEAQAVGDVESRIEEEVRRKESE